MTHVYMYSMAANIVAQKQILHVQCGSGKRVYVMFPVFRKTRKKDAAKLNKQPPCRTEVYTVYKY